MRKRTLIAFLIDREDNEKLEELVRSVSVIDNKSAAARAAVKEGLKILCQK